MGEDKSKSTEVSHCRRSSVMSSSCSEDAESTSTGYPDESDERDEELEYGPGIVHKLRTRYLSITLKQNRGTNMRRSCSMENLLDQGRPTPSPKPIEKTNIPTKVQNWGHLKRAKSMDTLLMEMNPVKDCDTDDKKLYQPKIIKRLDGGLTRPVVSICDEELPKPDTVKTYKRMFEPAESRRGSYCRRPPVLRASAKSSASTKTNGTAPITISAKLNGSTSLKSRISAKQQLSSMQKIQTDSLSTTIKKHGDQPSRPRYNGSHVVTATPVKITPHRNCKNNCAADVEKRLNSLNQLMSKKDVNLSSKSDVICNGNGNVKDNLPIKTTEEAVKHFSKNITNGCPNKPKVPPNRPTLKCPRPFPKIDEHVSNIRTPSPKLKPCFINGTKKIDKEVNSDSCLSPQRVKSPEGMNNVIKENRLNGEFIKVCELEQVEILSECSKEVDVLKLKLVNVDKISTNKDNELDKAVMSPVENGKLFFSKLKEPAPISKEPPLPKIANLETNKSSSTAEKKVIPNGFNSEDRPKSPSNSFPNPVRKNIPNGVASGDQLKPTTPPSCSVRKNSPNGIECEDLSLAVSQLNPVKKTIPNGVLSEDESKSPAIPTPNLVKKDFLSGTGSKSPPSFPSRKSFQNGLISEDQPKTSSPHPVPLRKPVPVAEEQPKSASPSVPLKKPAQNEKSPDPSPEVPIKPAIKKSSTPMTSMVFDFRGKDVVSHVAVVPAPFGCKDIIQKRSEVPNGTAPEEEDEDSVDYSVPPPCGLVFEGENIKIGRGSILSKRNKDLKLSFDEDVDNNTFVYPSETSLLEDPDKSSSSSQSPAATEVIPNGQPPPLSKLKSNTVVGSGTGLSTYTPSVLRTVDNFEPGMFRHHPEKPEPAENCNRNQEEEEENSSELLKPADPHLISSWSMSAGTPDLLF